MNISHEAPPPAAQRFVPRPVFLLISIIFAVFAAYLAYGLFPLLGPVTVVAVSGHGFDQ